MSKADEYVEALARLDRTKAAGNISDKEYEFHKARLKGEAKTARPLGVKLLRFALIVAVLIGILWVGSMWRCSLYAGNQRKPSAACQS